ncbi:UNVERIFIED_CONTAM: protein misato1 [Sesamum radiatum]|uniref:Protein misato1 n=1 Tax=Sesamum radiatum TaxID=300843 RepID=A0AAW2U6X9_SESRA
MCRTGPVTTHTSQPLKKNLFLQSLYLEETEDVGTSRDCPSRNGDFCPEVQDKDIVECLENEVQYWTDFSKVHYHPQSLYELSGLWFDIKDFNNYGIGREAFSGGLHAEEINERLRFFVEECDLPQGIQFIIDDSGGFSGVAGEFLENIADEYTNIPVLLYSVCSPYSSLDSTNRKLTLSRKLHDAVSFSKLSTFSKLIVPMGLPSLRTRCKRASVSEVKDAVQTAYSTAAERPRFSHLSVAQCPLPIPLPFPSIFGNLVGQHGEISDTPISESASRGSLEVHSIPMAARLRSSSCVLPFLENRLENLRKFGIARGALGSELLASWGFGKDDVEDMGETLSNMVRTLNPVSELSSDSD